MSNPEANQRLRLSIQTLYEVMAHYPARPVMPASPAYGDAPAAWNRDLFSKPLRELTADDLSRFTGKAITTWGGTDDFKHFLPRIFELTAALDARIFRCPRPGPCVYENSLSLLTCRRAVALGGRN